MKINTIFNTLNNSTKLENGENVIIPQIEPKKIKNSVYIKSMDEYERDMLEERVSIMTICGEVPEADAETLAVADIISLRDRSGLTGSIIDILGGVEIMNPNMKVS